MIGPGRRGFGLAALTLAAACALPPQGTSETDRANYLAAARSLDCALVTEGDYVAMEIQSGLSRQQLIDLTGYYLATERAVRLPEGGVKLTTGACA